MVNSQVNQNDHKSNKPKTIEPTRAHISQNDNIGLQIVQNDRNSTKPMTNQPKSAKTITNQLKRSQIDQSTKPITHRPKSGTVGCASIPGPESLRGTPWVSVGLGNGSCSNNGAGCLKISPGNQLYKARSWHEQLIIKAQHHLRTRR